MKANEWLIPDDARGVLVIECDRRLTQEQMAQLRRRVSEELPPTVSPLILDWGLRVGGTGALKEALLRLIREDIDVRNALSGAP